MELRQLKYFIAVIESGSFSKATTTTHVVQSALSQQISSLEAELDVRLLVRSAQGVTPTVAGQLLYQHAQHLLRQAENTKAVVRKSKLKPAGPASIGLPTSTAATLSVPLLEACLSRYPEIQLRITEGLSSQMHQELNNGRLDMAIQFSRQPTRALKTRRLLTEELFLVNANCCKDADRKIANISLSRLRELRLLLPARGNGLRDLAERSLMSVGVAVSPLAEVSSLGTLINATQRGIGATLLPWGAFHREHAAGKLCASRVDNLTIQRGLMLCISEALPLTEAAQAIYGLVIEVVRGLVRDGVWQEVELAHNDLTDEEIPDIVMY